MKYASVIVNISHENLDKVYEYAIPEEWEKVARVGSQVAIPFGKGNRQIKGFILAISDTSEFDPSRIKPLASIIEDGMILESHFIQLASWIREQYGSTMNDALRAVLPVKKKMKEQQKRYLHLRVSYERLSRYMEECERKHWKARLRLAEALLECEELEYTEVVKQYQVSRDAIKKLEEIGIIEISSQKTYRNPIESHICEENKINLTEEQQNIVDTICADYDRQDDTPVLIHGVTGSGKTEIYMELLQHVIELGKQAIFLIPEIALTVPMVERFYQRFGDRISVLHSRLSEGERSDQYSRAQNGEIDIMIGPRSALFTPFCNLGMIIVDEEHEPSYQNENQPKYHTREVAIARAKMCGAMVVMGSATPSVESYYKCQQKEYKLFEVKNRAGDSVLPEISVVDMREELKQKNRSIFSRELAEKMQQALQEKKQILLFLNRRGYTGFISCRACGYVAKCPHCDVSLTEHKNGKLICHYCGYEQSRFQNCPSCGSKYIAGFGIGTQKVEEFTQKMFPNARTLRMDADTTSRKGQYEKILATFESGQADILIGTQMIAKGHDFSNVAVVGALAADLSLNFNDFRSAERTFQLLSQAGGRAGRRKEQGSFVIQSYEPKHYAIQAVKNQDYQQFYQEELAYRSMLHYPPKGQILAIILVSKMQDSVEFAAKLLTEAAKTDIDETELIVIGPANATIYRVNDFYRKVIYIKAEEKNKLVERKEYLNGYVKYSQYFKQIHVYYDFNPMNGY